MLFWSLKESNKTCKEEEILEKKRWASLLVEDMIDLPGKIKKSNWKTIQTNNATQLGGQILYKYTKVVFCPVRKQQWIKRINDKIYLLQTNELQRKKLGKTNIKKIA